MSQLKHSYSPAPSRRAQRGFVGWSPGGLSLPRFLHPTHSLTCRCNCTLCCARHLLSLPGSFGSRECTEPVLGPLAASPGSEPVGEWEGSCWVSASSISEPQTGRDESPSCLPAGHLPQLRAGRSCSKMGLTSVVANLWPFLHVLCFFF